MSERITAIFPFCGIGGGAIGAMMARPEAFGVTGQVEVICGMDVDPDACRSFEEFTGAPAYQFDFFSRQQYIDWHGHEPPDDWRELTPDDIWRACDYRTPDFSFRSAPCKGFTGLLGGKKSKSKKYQALNHLAIRETELTLKAFEHDPIPVMLLENVPGIQTRGKDVLDKLKQLMTNAGYLIKETVFCCGEIGGLGARRKRYILICKHPDKCSAEIFEPTKLPLKTIGDVIGPLPLPGDVAFGGRHHREQNLSFLVALRLAAIAAGKDWKYLETLDWWNLRIEHMPRNGAWAVDDWKQSARTISGAAGPGRSNTTTAISDPRLGYKAETHGNIYRLYRSDETGPSVTGACGPNNGAVCISDPRIQHNDNKQGNAYRISRVDEPAPTITGSRIGSGGIAIADPGLNCSPRNGTYGVLKMDEPAPTVTGGDVHSGTSAVADPRIPGDYERGVWIIISLDGTRHRALTTYELAMLQGMPQYMPDGRPFELVGVKSDKKARELIGNLVPPPSAKRWIEEIGAALICSRQGITFRMSHQPVWVMPEDEWLPAIVH